MRSKRGVCVSAGLALGAQLQSVISSLELFDFSVQGSVNPSFLPDNNPRMTATFKRNVILQLRKMSLET